MLPALRLLFKLAPLRDTLLSYLHVCDVYVLRLALPWAKLSVRALEQQRNCSNTRLCVAKHALVTCASYTLYRWCCTRGIGSDRHLALSHAVASGSVPLFKRVSAEQPIAELEPGSYWWWDSLMVAAARCTNVEMLRAVLLAGHRNVSIAVLRDSVPCEAARMGRVDVLEFCEHL